VKINGYDCATPIAVYSLAYLGVILAQMLLLGLISSRSLLAEY